jgi:hypothetical protein
MGPKLYVGKQRDGAYEQPTILAAIYSISILKYELLD